MLLILLLLSSMTPNFANRARTRNTVLIKSMNPTRGPKIEVKMAGPPPSRGSLPTRNWTEAGVVDFDPIVWKALFYCSSLKELYTTVIYGTVPSLFSIFLLCNFIPGFSMSMAVFVSGIHCAALVFMGLLSGRLSKGWVFFSIHHLSNSSLTDPRKFLTIQMPGTVHWM